MILLRTYKAFTKEPYYYGALAYAFLIPFFQLAATIAMGLWLGLSFLGYRRTNNNKKSLLLLFPALFVSYLVGMLWFHEVSYTIMEHKLSLLVFPLIFYLHSYNGHQKRNILRLFVLGLCFSLIICFGIALYRSISLYGGSFHFAANVLADRDFFESILYGGNYFFGQQFSIFHQTVYFALYLSTGVALLLFCRIGISERYKLLLIAFFVIAAFLISNKAGLVSLALIFPLKLIVARYSLIRKLVLSLSFLAGLVIIGLANPRMLGSIKKLAKGELEIDKEARYDFKTRLLSWDAAIDLIGQSPILGYGAANTQNELDRVYEQKEYVFPLKNRNNAHNQFLQIWLENGLLGLVLFLSVFMGLIITAREGGANIMLISAMVVLFFLNALFESYLNRFSGISYFTCVCCFIFSGHKEGRAVY
ncbi:O-antigen ligase family protein [Flavobacteriaceae bacterium F89]|uniref:O-antigen ligase family protein n=1 Tax=Cerina litoralis TaxID=2874477 RepID=A0AAE3EQA1_9FLAO|nr:O-antigen ligase family protein [Cerina litoralis]MCG2459125.1 O-antigen ligase family protein [Cerina litoralis]